MKVIDPLEPLFHIVTDGLYAGIPQPKPGQTELRRCKIISHRGEHDNIDVFENTLAAFDRASDSGVWGLECDIRWTKDLVPVIFHDADLQRLFGSPLIIGETEFDKLRREFPQIPTLLEVLTRYGKKLHLMVEIKAEAYPEPEYQRLLLSQAFSGLVPEEDYHFLALDPQLFQHVNFVSSTTCIPVALLNLRELSPVSLQEHYGGIAGHYLFITETRIQSHQEQGQKVGTAYIRSKNSLFREINRGVDWVFSNHACEMQDILNQLI